MSDHFETLVLSGVPLSTAEALATDIIAWLVDRGTIGSDRLKNVLGGEGWGYPPGPNADQDCSAFSAATDSFGVWRGLLTNGLEIETGSIIAIGETSENDVIYCPRCGTEQAVFALGSQLEQWKDTGEACVACAACGMQSDLDLWDGDGHWAFGRIGITVWNWPPLAPGFKHSLEERAGHVVRTVLGRI